MKLFTQTTIAKNFIHPDREAILKYVDLICNKNSEMNAIENIDERKQAARTKAKWAGTEDKDLKERIEELEFHYLSYFQGHNDFSLLLSRQELFNQMLQAIREPLSIQDEDKYLKSIKIKGEINNLLEQLGPGIKKLYEQIYGTPERQEVAVKKVTKILTPELRLRPTA